MTTGTMQPRRAPPRYVKRMLNVKMINIHSGQCVLIAAKVAEYVSKILENRILLNAFVAPPHCGSQAAT